jgi:hypothetical protein
MGNAIKCNGRRSVLLADATEIWSGGFQFVVKVRTKGAIRRHHRGSVTTIMMDPVTAKDLERQLQRALFRYEHFVGPILDHNQPSAIKCEEAQVQPECDPTPGVPGIVVDLSCRS